MCKPKLMRGMAGRVSHSRAGGRDFQALTRGRARSRLLVALVPASALLAACAAGVPAPAPAPPQGDRFATTAPPAELRAPRFAPLELIVLRQGYILALDTETGVTDTIARIADPYTPHVRVAPTGDRILLAAPVGDSTSLLLIDGGKRSARVIESRAIPGLYFFAWAPNSTGAFAYTFVPFSGQPVNVQVDSAGSKRRLPCRTTTFTMDWPSPDALVLYEREAAKTRTVSSADCRPLAEFDMNFEKVSAAPVGGRLLITRGLTIRDRTRGTSWPGSELRIGEVHSDTSKLVVGYEDRPGRAQWSPDGLRVVVEVESRRYENIRQIGFVDALRHAFVVLTSESPIDGLASERTPVWAPDSRRVAYNRSWPSLVPKEQIVVYDVEAGAAQVLHSDTWAPTIHRWLTTGHLLLHDNRSQFEILDVQTGGKYVLPDSDGILLAIAKADRPKTSGEK